MLSEKISREDVEMLINCNSEEEVYEKLKELDPECEMQDAEMLYNTFLHMKEEGDSEDMNGMCLKFSGVPGHKPSYLSFDWESPSNNGGCGINYFDPKVCRFYKSELADVDCKNC